MDRFMNRDNLLLKFFGVNYLQPKANKAKRSRMTNSSARRTHRRMTTTRNTTQSERFTIPENEPLVSDKVLRAQAAILSGEYDSPEILCTALERLLETLES